VEFFQRTNYSRIYTQGEVIIMAHTTKNRQKGFTLIELIAVIVVLVILAGVALPKYFDYSAAAKESAVKGTLGGVRSGVANYFANASIEGEAAYPTLAELETIGMVMQEPIPPNPYRDGTDAHTIRDAKGEWKPDEAPPVSGTAGWAYDEETGRFWANSNSVSTDKGGPENTW